jgi:hypothetical protein
VSDSLGLKTTLLVPAHECACGCVCVVVVVGVR